ncbi:MAG: tetratricopeptide (TPR) repeat protein [Polyangiales bacterium]|jgi:tetratricopeptide (TPR) repeat protein
MGKQGKSVVIGVMVLAMAAGSVGSMMGGRPPPQTEGAERGQGTDADIEAIDMLPLANEAETAAFGVELAAQLALPNPDMDFDAVVALDQIAIRALSPELSPEVQARFARGVTGNRGRVPQFVEQIHSRVQSGARLKYLGTTAREEHTVARFRLVDLEGGVDFLDLLIGIQSRRPVIVDSYSLMVGWQSELYADFFHVGVLEHAVDASEITALGEAARDEEYEEVLRLYDALPEAAQSLRSIWAVRIAAAGASDNVERYMAILDEFTTQFPNDRAAQMQLLDVHLEREQWAAASADVDALDDSFPDPYWNGHRATIAEGQGEYALALELAEALIQADPTLFDGPDVALSASLATGDLERANGFATTLRDDFGLDLAELATQPGYEAIAQLPVFAAQPADPTQP